MPNQLAFPLLSICSPIYSLVTHCTGVLRLHACTVPLFQDCCTQCTSLTLKRIVLAFMSVLEALLSQPEVGSPVTNPKSGIDYP